MRVPHDFIVEGNFSSSGDKSHGYLPYAVGYYRKHLTLPSEFYSTDNAYFLHFDGVQTTSTVYLDGQLLGAHASGYTPFDFELNHTVVKQLTENDGLVLAVEADGTKPDGWWYDGGGIYRHVKLSVVPNVHISLWGGAYTPAIVTGTITNLTASAAEVRVGI